MMGTINCVYETPCGWCSKWDKKCDNKIGKVDSHCNKDKDLENIRSGKGLTLADVYPTMSSDITGIRRGV